MFSLLLVLQLQYSFCQTTTDSVVVLSGGEYLKSYLDNSLRFVSQPARWKKKDWTIFGTSVIATAGLTFVDEDINRPFLKWNQRDATFGKIGGLLGSTPVIVGTAVLTTGIAFAIKNARLKNFALDNLQAQIFTGGFTYITKYMFGRARPYQDRGANYWDGPFKANRFESFFSGHSSIAFSTATMIFLHSHKKPWVGLVAYGTATAIGISRMQNQKHWASDVLMGAVSGWAVSSFIYHQNEKKRTEKRLRLF